MQYIEIAPLLASPTMASPEWRKSRPTLNVNFICSLSGCAGMIAFQRPFGVSAGRGRLA